MSPLTGYNAPIPDMEARKEIKDKLIVGFDTIKNPEDGMVIFGSFRDVEITHDDSDLDLVLYRHDEKIFTSNEWLSALGHVLAESIGEYSGMKIDVNVLDHETTMDGRFLSTAGILGEVEKGEIYGKEFRHKIKRVGLLIPEENQLAFGLRKVRIEAVRSIQRAERNDEEDLRKSFRDVLSSFSSLHYMLPRLVSTYGGDGEEFFHDVADNKIYRDVSEVYKDIQRILEIENQGFDEIQPYLFTVKNFYEQCINEIMTAYPNPGQRESVF